MRQVYFNRLPSEPGDAHPTRTRNRENAVFKKKLGGRGDESVLLVEVGVGGSMACCWQR